MGSLLGLLIIRDRFQVGMGLPLVHLRHIRIRRIVNRRMRLLAHVHIGESARVGCCVGIDSLRRVDIVGFDGRDLLLAREGVVVRRSALLPPAIVILGLLFGLVVLPVLLAFRRTGSFDLYLLYNIIARVR